MGVGKAPEIVGQFWLNLQLANVWDHNERYPTKHDQSIADGVIDLTESACSLQHLFHVLCPCSNGATKWVESFEGVQLIVTEASLIEDFHGKLNKHVDPEACEMEVKVLRGRDEIEAISEENVETIMLQQSLR